jgi:hypothetical protein
MQRDSNRAEVAASPFPPPLVDRRSSFAFRLDQQLRPHGIGLISANLGSLDGKPVWVLAVQLKTRQVVTLHAPLDRVDSETFSEQACALLADRIVTWAGAPR